MIFFYSVKFFSFYILDAIILSKDSYLKYIFHKLKYVLHKYLIFFQKHVRYIK
jgi:hypothetical protein